MPRRTYTLPPRARRATSRWSCVLQPLARLRFSVAGQRRRCLAVVAAARRRHADAARLALARRRHAAAARLALARRRHAAASRLVTVVAAAVAVVVNPRLVTEVAEVAVVII